MYQSITLSLSSFHADVSLQKSLSFLLLIWREDGKLRRKGNEGHLWCVSCEFNCHVCRAELLFGLLQQDFKLLRTSCCCNAETTINITWSLPALRCLILLFAFTLLCTSLYCGRVCIGAPAVWWQNVATGKTVGTPSHCPQWLPLSFPHTHTCNGKEAIVTQTHWTHYLRGWPFFLKDWKVKNRECRKGEERRKADKTKPDPLRADSALCNTIWCTPPNLIPFKHTHSFSHSQKTLPKPA